ncbi:hypothetical protein DFP94_102229 [Fontibacillus phaseoli]|uniref:Uncharacterized protein n=1 Tax=Fontibacillus phaseoli TaxID=1416533 RepID=A0A369BLK5_9BACL|nr:hypothetical protein [Fontibacillus phaseoli]RCX21476.1 hypothetical protein DFP94_102229 [Fontibacillus phaseoli]
MVIDSINEIVDYIINYDLSETAKKEMINLENTIGLHFSLGMHIRNNYELSDVNKVPNLIKEYRQLNNIAIINYDEIDEELRGFYEFIDGMSVNEDGLSYFIINLIWRRIKNV